MDEMIKFLNGFNVQTILSTGAIVWYLTSDLKKELGGKIDRVEKDLGGKIDRIEKDFHEMNTRTSRVEGTVYGKDIYNKIE